MSGQFDNKNITGQIAGFWIYILRSNILSDTTGFCVQVMHANMGSINTETNETIQKTIQFEISKHYFSLNLYRLTIFDFSSIPVWEKFALLVCQKVTGF